VGDSEPGSAIVDWRTSGQNLSVSAGPDSVKRRTIER